MTIETDLFETLRGLVSNRVFPDTFPQNTAWPAIRYTLVAAIPGEMICGSGDDPETDFRVQIDAVAKTGDARDALRVAIQAAMRTYPIPTTVDGWAKQYDAEAKAYLVRMDYFIQPSSSASSPP